MSKIWTKRINFFYSVLIVIVVGFSSSACSEKLPVEKDSNLNQGILYNKDKKSSENKYRYIFTIDLKPDEKDWRKKELCFYELGTHGLATLTPKAISGENANEEILVGFWNALSNFGKRGQRDLRTGYTKTFINQSNFNAPQTGSATAGVLISRFFNAENASYVHQRKIDAYLGDSYRIEDRHSWWFDRIHAHLKKQTRKTKSKRDCNQHKFEIEDSMKIKQHLIDAHDYTASNKSDLSNRNISINSIETNNLLRKGSCIKLTSGSSPIFQGASQTSPQLKIKYGPHANKAGFAVGTGNSSNPTILKFDSWSSTSSDSNWAFVEVKTNSFRGVKGYLPLERFQFTGSWCGK